MNIKLNLVLIVVAIFLIATACSPDSSSSLILDRAQPERLYKSVPSLPVTGANETVQQAYDFEQEARAYPGHQLHSACASEDIRRQGKCEEKEQNVATFLSGNGNTEAPAHPSQKLHADCVSEDIRRQNNCVE